MTIEGRQVPFELTYSLRAGPFGSIGSERPGTDLNSAIAREERRRASGALFLVAVDDPVGSLIFIRANALVCSGRWHTELPPGCCRSGLCRVLTPSKPPCFPLELGEVLRIQPVRRIETQIGVGIWGGPKRTQVCILMPGVVSILVPRVLCPFFDVACWAAPRAARKCGRK